MEKLIAKSILFIVYASLVAIVFWATIITWDTNGFLNLTFPAIFIVAWIVAWACRVLDKPYKTIETREDMNTSEFTGDADITPNDTKIIVKSPTKPKR